MQKGIFERLLEKFIIFTNTSNDRPVLLILYGHSTKTKSIEQIIISCNNRAILVCFPPHCTHKLQPLEAYVGISGRKLCVIVMKPTDNFKKALEVRCIKY